MNLTRQQIRKVLIVRPRVLALMVLVGGLLFLGQPAVIVAQQNTGITQSTNEQSTGQTSEDPDGPPLTYLDSVTVTATLNPSTLRNTPGVVSVISSSTIQDRLMENIGDLVKYEPGVYVENNITRLGLNGFNIRGVGGNRVMTQVDGVQTSEQFDFGPFNVHQTSLDIDVLQSVEIVRSANSALYGSDALGGVVSLFTKDPSDYLRNKPFHIGVKTTWDSRADDASLNTAIAGGNSRFQASLFASVNRGHEFHNKGTVSTTDATRTTPNPQDRSSQQMLAKFVFTGSPGNVLRLTGETYDTDVTSNVFSQLGQRRYGPMTISTSAIKAIDKQDRWRMSIDHTLVERTGLDVLAWSFYGQANDTSQVVDETRTTMGFGPPIPAFRNGSLAFEQRGLGGTIRGQKWIGQANRGVLLTFGGSAYRDRFDVLRNRVDTHARTGLPIRSSLVFPTKYFPKSDVAETGAYIQAELQMGRLTLVPGVRYDNFSLDADQDDAIFLASLSPTPADFSADAVSPKVGAAIQLSDIFTIHAQYAGGFRAPPYSDINSGFTNVQSGYTALPNPALKAERSDNIEVGLRAALNSSSFSVTGFSNRYDDFIELSTTGFNRRTGLLEFQSQNVSQVNINGLELRAETFLADTVKLRGSYAAIEGADVSSDKEVPLGSIAPNEGVIGFQYLHESGRWTSDLSVRFVQGQSIENAGEDQYAPKPYSIVDFLNSVSLTETLMFRLGILNLTDKTYFEWWNVRGRATNDPVIDRYSSPGISIITSLAYDW